jgi:predicted nucleic acid-binding protein
MHDPGGMPGYSPMWPTVFTQEVLLLIETKKLYSRGIGLIDAHLLASTLIVADTQIWTADKRLENIAQEFGIAYLVN